MDKDPMPRRPSAAQRRLQFGCSPEHWTGLEMCSRALLKPDTERNARAGCPRGARRKNASTDPRSFRNCQEIGKVPSLQKSSCPSPVNGGYGPLGKEVPLLSLRFLELEFLELSPGRVLAAMSFYRCGNRPSQGLGLG